MRFKTVKAIALTLVSSFVLASCTPFQEADQKRWIKEMNKAFPEDNFTYIGHPDSPLGTDYDTILVSSEQFPNAVISVWKEKGEIRTNYQSLLYQEDCIDELDRLFEGYFPCSSYLISGFYQYNEGGYALEEMGARKFIKNYMDYNCTLILFYDDKSQVPSEEEMTDLLIDFASREPHEYSIYFDFCDAKYKDDEKLALKNYDVSYLLHMDEEDHIKHIYVSYKDGSADSKYLVKDVDL
ncbi:MAG: hypothetical protein IKF31_08395 [Clostridiales bacterium]|nr:hypothetical protein [Clostridiales bacterium]